MVPGLLDCPLEKDKIRFALTPHARMKSKLLEVKKWNHTGDYVNQRREGPVTALNSEAIREQD